MHLLCGKPGGGLAVQERRDLWPLVVEDLVRHGLAYVRHALQHVPSAIETPEFALGARLGVRVQLRDF